MVASNSSGKVETSVKVVVYDKPGVPTGPVHFESVTANSLDLTWKEPSETGGCTIIGYVIEKREAVSTVRILEYYLV